MPIFDSHLHIIDPAFPLIANKGYLPEAFTCNEYLARVKPLDVVGGAVVSGSFQGTDQSYLCAALKTLGSGFVGVTQLGETVSDDELDRLHRAGVRAARFNLFRGAFMRKRDIVRLAQRIYERHAWHSEFYLGADALDALAPTLIGLPKVSIDHLGMELAGHRILRTLVAKGVKVKATGFGRVDFDPLSFIQELLAIDPTSVMFGTDLPSTRAKRPFSEKDLALLSKNLDEKQSSAVLHDNAVAFYGFA